MLGAPRELVHLWAPQLPKPLRPNFFERNTKTQSIIDSDKFSLESVKVTLGGDTCRLAPLGIMSYNGLEEQAHIVSPQKWCPDNPNLLWDYWMWVSHIRYGSSLSRISRVGDSHSSKWGHPLWCLLPLGAPKQQAHFKGAPRGIQQNANFSVVSAIAHHNYCWNHIWLGF